MCAASASGSRIICCGDLIDLAGWCNGKHSGIVIRRSGFESRPCTHGESRVSFVFPEFLKKGGNLTEASSALTSSAFSSVITALQAQLSTTTVIEILAYTAGISVAFVFVWWGVRKASRALMGAFKKGKLKL